MEIIFIYHTLHLTGDASSILQNVVIKLLVFVDLSHSCNMVGVLS